MFILNNYTWGPSITQLKASIRLEPLREPLKKHILKLLYTTTSQGLARMIICNNHNVCIQRWDHSNKIQEIKCRTNYKMSLVALKEY